MAAPELRDVMLSMMENRLDRRAKTLTNHIGLRGRTLVQEGACGIHQGQGAALPTKGRIYVCNRHLPIAQPHTVANAGRTIYVVARLAASTVDSIRDGTSSSLAVPRRGRACIRDGTPPGRPLRRARHPTFHPFPPDSGIEHSHKLRAVGEPRRRPWPLPPLPEASRSPKLAGTKCRYEHRIHDQITRFWNSRGPGGCSDSGLRHGPWRSRHLGFRDRSGPDDPVHGPGTLGYRFDRRRPCHDTAEVRSRDASAVDLGYSADLRLLHPAPRSACGVERDSGRYIASRLGHGTAVGLRVGRVHGPDPGLVGLDHLPHSRTRCIADANFLPRVQT